MDSKPGITRPRVGVIGLAYPGYHLGEEMCGPKLAEAIAMLGASPVEVTPASQPAMDEAGARRAGEEMAKADVDCILAVITTFIPDYFVTELLARCPVPVFLWAVEREMQCISLVCGPLITATLYNLNAHYRLAAADIPDETARRQFLTFARAAMLRRVLRRMRVGYWGGKPPIMFSMSVDEYELKRRLGVTVVNLPMQSLYRAADAVSADAAGGYWNGLRRGLGDVTVTDADGIASSRLYLAARRLAEENQLDALSLNCFPDLKSRICLAVARLNDDGVAAACEGDLHSTILMHLLSCLTGRASFNGDFLRLYPESRDILFSHCGAGAFSLAAGPRKVCLRASIETCDGLAVCYATELRGPVTLLNLMSGPGTLRLTALKGDGAETDLAYEGTPLRVRFTKDVHEILQDVARVGAGHHWNGGAGDLVPEFTQLCRFLDVPFSSLTP